MTDLWDELCRCPPEAINWAALAYRLGDADGFDRGFRQGHRRAEEAMAEAWSAAGDAVRSTIGGPARAELARRRQVDHSYCSGRCMACSSCLHAEAWRRRGGREFLGVDAERWLAELVGGRAS